MFRLYSQLIIFCGKYFHSKTVSGTLRQSVSACEWKQIPWEYCMPNHVAIKNWSRSAWQSQAFDYIYFSVWQVTAPSIIALSISRHILVTQWFALWPNKQPPYLFHGCCSFFFHIAPSYNHGDTTTNHLLNWNMGINWATLYTFIYSCKQTKKRDREKEEKIEMECGKHVEIKWFWRDVLVCMCSVNRSDPLESTMYRYTENAENL